MSETGCWSCGRVIEDVDPFCRFCGVGQGSSLAWYYRPGGIVFLTLFALGPFVLPLIWRTPRLAMRGRVIGTLLLAAFTYYSVVSFINLARTFKTALAGAGLAL